MGVSGSGILTASLPANGDECRRRRRYQRINPISNVAPTTPPTTPPAICPACESFFWVGLELEELWGAADVVDDAWIVEGSFGVASGES